MKVTITFAALVCLLTSNHVQAQATAAKPVLAPPANYKLSPNDQLDIRVFQEEDLTTVTRIPRDGVITFPLIGRVEVGGKTVSDAEDLIRTRLGKRFLVNPQVTMIITEYVKLRFTVIGQVQHPGAYDLPSEQEIDLLEAIAMAGGYTKVANAADVAVKRNEDGKEVVYRINAKKIARKEGVEKFTVKPGDTITINQSIF